MEKESTSGARRRGGRGARERILEAAAALFYEEGIHATGVARLVETAEVSTRTFYQHFPSKTALVEEYLRRYEAGPARRVEERLAQEGLSPQDQLLAQFVMVAEAASGGAGDASTRGCPLHNAAVEAAGSMPQVRELVQRNREDVVRQFTDIATRAGAADPERLGRQLAVLLEGATAMSTSLDSHCPRQDALDAARVLIEHALPEAQPVN
ncbi:TetR/AcrR family transcriptional regulator [Streptomyces gibsoniae]|uniref:Helix-turn-helix domain-containing protein n=1 Tax=Streptomyces gibsoniae TaxID=3075529 RepID=A0ABU2TQM1_9ACTN|nr:helix-turn-helix domain-containing protein [Streptomyces sp. DSM 41699]MDT0463252.1 helix-turn-helix domain-containing protein [Streptomyces sp. DSM 41699]